MNLLHRLWQISRGDMNQHTRCKNNVERLVLERESQCRPLLQNNILQSRSRTRQCIRLQLYSCELGIALRLKEQKLIANIASHLQKARAPGYPLQEHLVNDASRDPIIPDPQRIQFGHFQSIAVGVGAPEVALPNARLCCLSCYIN